MAPPEVGQLLTRAQIIYGAAVLAMAFLATAEALRRRSALGFLGVWFFLILAPTSSVMPMDAAFAAEHRMYLPLMAVVAAAVLGAHGLWIRLGSSRISGKALVALLVLGAGSLGTLTHLRNRDYHSQFKIWNSSILSWPINPRGHVNRGAAHARAGRHALAIRDYDKAIAANPDQIFAHLSRGMVLEASGDHDQAIASYSRAVGHARRRRASDRGRLRTGENDRIESLALNGWAWILATSSQKRHRDGARAVTFARRANELTHQKSAAMLDTLAAAHAEAGQFDEAVKVVQKAIAMDRSSADVREYRQRLVSYRARRPHREFGSKP